ncbi:MAG: cytochrome c biogenesis protein ResB [Deferrisomatales bacterium]|nr:cytochrome c biogenesis protein ResB [Deferrisomatales bacterium]
MAKNPSSPGARLLAALASLKLCLFLFFSLAVTSIFGTVIQQQADPREYIASYGPTLAKLITTFGLQDMYYSWWFQLLLGLLLANTLVCSLRRLPTALRAIRGDQFETAEQLARRGSAVTWEAPLGTEEAVATVMQEQFGRARHQSDGDGTTWFVQKQPWARLGAYVAHASLVLFFLGGIVGARYGFKGYVNIVEGQSVNAIQLRSGEQMELPFEVECQEFELVTYPDGRPKDYLSRLVARRDGAVLQEKTIEVNHPLIQDGIFFYQSSYGTSGGGVVVSAQAPDGTPLFGPVRLTEWASAAIPGTNLRLEMKASTEDFQGFGPGAQLALLDASAGGHVHVGAPFVVLQNFPEFDRRRGGEHVFRLERFDPGQQYTGLQVAKDPGVPLVWAASILLTVGTLMAFFANHSRVWVRLEGGRLTVAGHAARGGDRFRPALDELTTALKNETAATAPAAECA